MVDSALSARSKNGLTRLPFTLATLFLSGCADDQIMKPHRHHSSVCFLLAVLLTLVSACDPSSLGSTTAGQLNPPSQPRSQSEDRVYQVGRRIRDFPEKEDLSTPETAAAAMQRAAVSGESLRRFVIESQRAWHPTGPSGKPLPAVYARRWLNEEIVEVQIHGGTSAAVYRWELSFWGAYFTTSLLELHDGKWLHAGENLSRGIQLARAYFATWCRYHDQEAARRAPVKEPERHLEPLVSFLRTEGEDPQAFVLKALADHQLVIMGEVHHRPRYWAFNASLVEAATFPRHVGVIYLELPGSDQTLVDQFLSRSQLDPQPAITMLRDMSWTGWPDQPTLDFFITVWKVNRSLPPQQKLRLVLVDPRAAWKDDEFRDRKMADAILQDLRSHRDDHRHGLFIVGLMHAILDGSVWDGSPRATSGWFLRRKLGTQAVCAIHQHRPVRFGDSERLERPALGLFDSAFSALHNQPIAFPLDHGPFGQVPLDDCLDGRLYTTNRYQDAFSAYLYLGPLEDEIFSPLIPGFYTDEFVRELDRRHRLLFGKGLVEGWGLARLDGASFTACMSQDWGKPRAAWSATRLGPLTKWHQGLPEETANP
jgi:hypothetical protein